MLKKTWTFDYHSDETVFPTRNTLEGWYLFYLKGGIHSSILSSKASVYYFRKLRYKQIKLGQGENRLIRVIFKSPGFFSTPFKSVSAQAVHETNVNSSTHSCAQYCPKEAPQHVSPKNNMH